MKTQFITDDHGKKVAVIVPVKDYEKIMDELDDLECVKAYDKIKARKEKSISFEEYLKQRRKKNHA